MRCLRPALVFAATVFVVAATEAQPQPRPSAPVQPTPLAVVVLSSIDDPVVIAELKLKDEQVTALVARRTELWDEAYITGPSKLAEKAAARTEATDALLKKTLTADQYKRAVQLGAQSVLRSPRTKGGEDGSGFRVTTVTPTILRRYPELVTAFKLTDDQKKQIAEPATGPGEKGGFARSIVMSKDQSAAAKEFLGAEAKAGQVKSDPRLAARPGQPANFALLGAKDVRTDLELTDADAKVLAELSEKWQKLASDRFADLSPKDADAQAAVLKTESEKALATLKPGQVARLKQIAFQTGGGGFGGFGRPTGTDVHIEQLYTNGTVVKELAVTDKQAEEFAALRAAFEKDATALLGSADAFATAEKELNELVTARRAKAEALLTAEQTAKLTALVGKPFVGSTLSDRSGRTGGPAGLNSEAMRAATFGKHSLLEFNLLATNKSVQEELKLDEKQIKKAVEIRASIPNQLPNPADPVALEKSLAERSTKVAEELSKLLSEDQAKRFRQILLQYWETRPGPPSGIRLASPITYPGVAEAVKLSEDQKKKLLAGTAVAEVLSDAQKSAIKEMLGTPFKGDFGTTFGGPRNPTPFPQTPGLASALRVASSAKAAEEALKLTAEQSKALAAARETYQKTVQAARPTGPGANTNDYIAALRTAADTFDKAVADILTADQKPRFAQLVVQYNAAASLVATLTATETAKQLELTMEQTAKLTALADEAAKLQGLRTMHVSSDARELKLGLQMRDAADERMMAVLTDAQKKKWKELTGEPLSGLPKTVPFGPGGRFGGGPGGGFGGTGGAPGGFPGGGFGGPVGP